MYKQRDKAEKANKNLCCCCWIRILVQVELQWQLSIRLLHFFPGNISVRAQRLVRLLDGDRNDLMLQTEKSSANDHVEPRKPQNRRKTSSFERHKCNIYVVCTFCYATSTCLAL